MTGRLKAALGKAGLDRRDTAAWALFDWGDNAFATVVLGVVLPVYYVDVAGATLPENLASVYWGYTLAISFGVVAVASPVLGAIADHLERSRAFLAAFTGLGVVFTGALVVTGEGRWLLTSALIIVANIGFSGARLFYNSLLPGITDGETIDRVSAAGYALGYFGGGTLLLGSLAITLNPEAVGLADAAAASRLSLFAAACWWAVFAIPLFVYVPEPDRSTVGAAAGAPAVDSNADTQDDATGRHSSAASRNDVLSSPVAAGYGRLRETAGDLRNYRDAFLFLVAFWLYANGINAIISLSAAYATEIGLTQTAVVGAFAMVQFVGVPCAIAFGQLAGRYSTKRALYGGLLVYLGVGIVAPFISTALHFFALAFAVALVQGGTQALSRSLFGSMIPEAKSAEFFSFFTIVAGFASVLGPLLFSVVGQLTGSTRIAVGSLTIFFITGTLMLTRVDVEDGRAAVRAGDVSDTTAEVADVRG